VEEVPHIFIEYVDGGNLEEWIESGRCADLKRALDLAIQGCHGMEHAHGQGMIHRDLKPKNILLTREGVLKVTDFGTARMGGWESEEEVSGKGEVRGAGLTAFGTEMGTYDYMAPEQSEDPHGVDERADLYSFGVCLYEMFCGRKPYDSADRMAVSVLAKKDNRPPHEPTELRPEIPTELAALLKRSCALEVSERYGSFAELRQALAGIYQEHFGEAAPHAEVKLLELKADGLNNRAISLLDLGRREEAEQTFEEALEADPHHLEATYNRGLLLWRSGRMTDDELVRQLEEVRTTHAGDWRDEYLLGQVHIERGDAEAAIEVLEEAAREAQQEEEIVQSALAEARAGTDRWLCVLRRFEGSMKGVTSVAVISDSQWMISGGSDQSLHLWDLETGRCLRTLNGHTDAVESVSTGPTGQLTLSGSRDNTLRLWEVLTGRCLKVLEGHTDYVRSVCISPNGIWGLSGSDDKTLRLWDLVSGGCLKVLEGHTDYVRCVCISPDSRLALSGGNDGCVRLWELPTGKCLRVIQAHGDSVRCVGIGPSGRWAISGSEDRTLRLWQLPEGSCIRICRGHTEVVSCLSISGDGSTVLSGGLDGNLRLWEVSSGRCVRTFESHGDYVLSVHITTDDRRGISLEREGTIWLWAISERGPAAEVSLAPPARATKAAAVVSLVNRAKRIASSALQEGRVSQAASEIVQARRLPGHSRDPLLLELWRRAGRLGRCRDLEDAWFGRIFTGHGDSVTSISVSRNGRRAISGSGDGSLRLWDLTTGQCLKTLAGQPGSSWITCVALSLDGRWALSGGHEKHVRLWELETGQCVKTFEEPVYVRSLGIGPDGRWAVSGSYKGTLQLLELKTGRCLCRFEGSSRQVPSVAFGPDGSWLLSGSMDHTLRLWDLSQGVCLRTFQGHTDNVVLAVAVSPHGCWGLSGSKDNTLRLWDLSQGVCLRTLQGHTDSVKSVAISPDGCWALSGSNDTTIRLWNLLTGRCARTFRGHAALVTSVAFTPDSHWALSGSEDKTLRLWELVWDYDFPEPADWDEGARPYLEIFLTLHTPYVGPDSLERKGQPTWNEEDFERLLSDLSYRGYGWLRPEGVRRQLEKMSREWEGASPIRDAGQQAAGAPTVPKSKPAEPSPLEQVLGMLKQVQERSAAPPSKPARSQQPQAKTPEKPPPAEKQKAQGDLVPILRSDDTSVQASVKSTLGIIGVKCAVEGELLLVSPELADNARKIADALYTEKTGHARSIYRDGTLKYDVECKAGKANGKGQMYYKDGNLCYDGEWQDGNWEGQGKYYKDGHLVYEGQFVGGKFQGKGKFYQEHGSVVYEGDVFGGKRHGQGRAYYKDGTLAYEGDFKNNQFHGAGKAYVGGVVYFQGEFRAGKPLRSETT
jgi:WD40 repeat protein